MRNFSTNVTKTLLLVLLPLVLLSAKCKDKVGPDGLPAITQTGANTFGCKVNGNVFAPKANFGSLPEIKASYNANDQLLQISGSNNTKTPLISIDLYISGLSIKSGDEFDLLKFDTPKAAGAHYSVIGGSVDNYDIVQGAPGKLRILKLDESQRIVSGTFSFEAVNRSGTKVSVTEGRFDLKY